jgi:hypothetical protein
MVTLTDTEAIMRRIPRSQWIEWLDELAIDGKVAVVSDDKCRPTHQGWVFLSAGYDPFDDLVEVMLQDERGPLRLLLESPSEILAVGTDADPEHITILAADGPLVITRSFAQSASAPSRGASRTGRRLIPV